MKLLILFSLLASAQTMTTLPSGATNQVVDRHCQCLRVSNSGPQSLMIPHRRPAEMTSFFVNPPPPVTLAACLATDSGPPTVSLPDVNTTSCGVLTAPVTVGGWANQAAPYSMNFFAGNTLPSCITNVIVNSVTVLYNATTGNLFNVCQGDTVQIQISCSAGTYSGQIRLRTTDGMSNIDSASVTIDTIEDCF